MCIGVDTTPAMDYMMVNGIGERQHLLDVCINQIIFFDEWLMHC